MTNIINMKKYGLTFSFDIGTSSIGWAATYPKNINKETGEILQEFEIVKSGVLLFNEPIEPKSKVLLNEKRRSKRLARRGKLRKTNRLDRVKNLIVANKLATQEELSEFNEQGEKNTKSIFTPKNNTKTPYELRVKGIDYKLEKHELAIVLYHCAKYRGFVSNAKQQKKDDDSGKVKEADIANTKKLEESKCRTMTEMFVKHLSKNQNIHNKGSDYSNSILRKHVIHEIELILNKQKEFYGFIDSDFIKRYKYIAFENRPLKSFFDSIGGCTIFGKDYKRAPKNSITAELFVVKSKLSNINYTQDGEKYYFSKEQIQNIIDKLYEKTEKSSSKTTPHLTFHDIRTILGLDIDCMFNLVSYKDLNKDQTEKELKAQIKKIENGKIAEFKTYFTLKELPSFKELETKELDIISEAVTYYKQNKDINDHLEKNNVLNKLNDDDLAFIYKLDFTQNINYCHKALYIILSQMDKFSDAMYDDYKKEYKITKALDVHHSIELATRDGLLPKHKNSQKFNKLPSLKFLEENDQDIPNPPSVKRAITNFRRLFNEMTEEFGKPNECKFELLRNIFGVEKKKATEKEQKERADKNNTIATKAKEIGASFISTKLWTEQKENCIYCKKIIAPDEVKDCQVDHILPYSKTFDDSLNNKALVHTSCNQNKQNRTPYEWLHNTIDWNVYISYIKSLRLNNKKTNNILTTKNSDELIDGFIARQFNESAYIARFIKNYIEKYYDFENPDKRNVLVVNGTLTNIFRMAYDLQKLRSKTDLENAELKIREYTERRIKNLAKKELTEADYLVEKHKIEESLKEKLNRARNNYVGDKHHAVDAILISLASHSNVKLISDVLHKTKDDKDSLKKSKNYLSKAIKNSIDTESSKSLHEKISHQLDNIFIKKYSEHKLNGAIHEETIYGAIKLNSLKPVDITYDKEYISQDDTNIITQRVPVLGIKRADLNKILKLGSRKYSYKQYILSNSQEKAILSWLDKQEEKKQNKDLVVEEFPYTIDKNGNKMLIRNITKISKDGFNSFYKLHNSKAGNKQLVGYVKPKFVVRTDVFNYEEKGKIKNILRPVTLADLTLLKTTSNKVEENILALGAGKSLSNSSGDDKYTYKFSLRHGDLFCFDEDTTDENGNNTTVTKKVYYSSYRIANNILEYTYSCDSEQKYKEGKKERNFVSIASVKNLGKPTISNLGKYDKQNIVHKEEYICPFVEYKNYLNKIKQINSHKLNNKGL